LDGAKTLEPLLHLVEPHAPLSKPDNHAGWNSIDSQYTVAHPAMRSDQVDRARVCLSVALREELAVGERY